MAAGLELPKQIISHGHWLKNNMKMSKSLGNGVDPVTLLAKYKTDPVRYFLLREGGISHDPGLLIPFLLIYRVFRRHPVFKAQMGSWRTNWKLVIKMCVCKSQPPWNYTNPTVIFRNG
jgi:hypothetical protein